MGGMWIAFLYGIASPVMLLGLCNSVAAPESADIGFGTLPTKVSEISVALSGR